VKAPAHGVAIGSALVRSSSTEQMETPVFRVSLVAALTAAALIAAVGTASAAGPDGKNGTSLNGLSQHGQGASTTDVAGTAVIGVELPASK